MTTRKISKTSAAAHKAWATRRRMAKEAEAMKAARKLARTAKSAARASAAA